MKYRKKPIIIEAYQTDVELDIETLEGVMHASIGDYIITGINGEKYPCKPDIFEKTYELVDEKKRRYRDMKITSENKGSNMEKKIRFCSIEHTMIFEKENNKIWISVFNGQVSERYYDSFEIKKLSCNSKLFG